MSIETPQQTREELNAFKNVHEILTLSSQEPRGTEPKEPYTMRMADDRRKLAEEICERNSSGLAAFLRGCMDELINGYVP